MKKHADEHRKLWAIATTLQWNWLESPCPAPAPFSTTAVLHFFGEDSFLKTQPNVPAKLLSFAFSAKFSLLKELIPNQGCRAKRVSIVEMPLIFLGTISSFSASRSIQRPVPLRFYSEKEAPHRLRKPVGSSSFQIIGGGIFMPTSRSTYPDGS